MRYESINVLQDKLRLSRVLNTVLLLVICVLGATFVFDHNANITNKNEFKISAAGWKAKAENMEATKDLEYAEVANDNATMAEDIAILCYMNAVLSAQNESLAQSNEELNTDLETFSLRSELYDKYDYAITNKYGQRTDITYDQLLLLEDLCDNKLVNDPDLYLAWIMTESGGVEKAKNATSSAAGYGQFLTSTSKWVYNKLCNFDEAWTSSAAYDGNTNITMMVAYVNYLTEANNGNLYQAIADYRGGYSDAYLAKIDSYLAEKGKSVKSIAKELNETFNTNVYSDDENNDSVVNADNEIELSEND